MQTYRIDIMRGRESMGEIQFAIDELAIEGIAWSSYEEADFILRSKKTWKWNEMVRTLVDDLTLSTGGRYTLRFYTTPSPEGRGERTLKNCMERANG